MQCHPRRRRRSISKNYEIEKPFLLFSFLHFHSLISLPPTNFPHNNFLLCSLFLAHSYSLPFVINPSGIVHLQISLSLSRFSAHCIGKLFNNSFRCSPICIIEANDIFNMDCVTSRCVLHLLRYIVAYIELLTTESWGFSFWHISKAEKTEKIKIGNWKRWNFLIRFEEFERQSMKHTNKGKVMPVKQMFNGNFLRNSLRTRQQQAYQCSKWDLQNKFNFN